ncbi:hypothetical protein [Paenibacillus sp. IITD108]|uniref:hypothetical protein n=1 Tax=Paenibacillus sp. IITD108 TaxID=3116649 RepID=UPI002F41B0D1
MMATLNQELPKLNDGGSQFFPSNDQVEDFMVYFISYLQKWGVLICVILVMAAMLGSLLAEAKKNPKFVRTFKFFSYGFAFIGVVLAFLPYFVLSEYNNTNIPDLPNDESSRSTLESVLYYLKSWQLLMCAYIIAIGSIFAYTARIRNNLRLKRKYHFFVYGAVLLAIVFYFLPGFVLNYLEGG